MPDIIDLKAARDRRSEAYWCDIRDQLAAIMADTDLDDAALTAATLYALLEALESENMSWSEARTFIATHLKTVWEPRKRYPRAAGHDNHTARPSVGSDVLQKDMGHPPHPLPILP
jgi:hypothetical protein